MATFSLHWRRAIETGKIIERQRIKLDISQRELARRAGLSPSTISRIEQGEIALTEDTALRLADYLGLQGSERTDFLITAGYPPFVFPESISSKDAFADVEFVRHIYEAACKSYDTGQFDRAESLFRGLIKGLAGHLRDPELARMRAWSQWALAGVLRLQGRAAESIRDLIEAETVGRRLGEADLEVDVMRTQGLALAAMRQPQQALKHYERALHESDRKSNALAFQGNTQRDRLSALIALGDFRDVEAIAWAGVEAMEKATDYRGVVMMWEKLGVAHLRQDQFRIAGDLLLHAFEATPQVGSDVLERAIIYVSLCDLFLAQGDLPAARFWAGLARDYVQVQHPIPNELTRLSTAIQTYAGQSLEQFLSQ